MENFSLCFFIFTIIVVALENMIGIAIKKSNSISDVFLYVAIFFFFF